MDIYDAIRHACHDGALSKAYKPFCPGCHQPRSIRLVSAAIVLVCRSAAAATLANTRGTQRDRHRRTAKADGRS